MGSEFIDLNWKFRLSKVTQNELAIRVTKATAEWELPKTNSGLLVDEVGKQMVGCTDIFHAGWIACTG